jgi:Zn-dependent protease with chaperone function
MSWNEPWLRTGDRSVERESLLATLIVLLGGLALQLFALWPGRIDSQCASRQLERLHWLVLWWPAAPALTVAAWLCGWALSQPDPVPGHVGRLIFIAAVPFAIVGGRALMRAAWSLCHARRVYGIVTVGLLRPRIVVAPELARNLDERALQAALAHERTHVRHRDPLRIWLAQFVTDLQWPWIPAQRRFIVWLATLECARDDEARAGGIEGADLAAAVLGSLRFQLGIDASAATLIGHPQALPARIARLLRPLPVSQPDREPPYFAVAAGLGLVWLVAIVLGISCGERLIGSLLAVSS